VEGEPEKFKPISQPQPPGFGPAPINIDPPLWKYTSKKPEDMYTKEELFKDNYD